MCMIIIICTHQIDVKTKKLLEIFLKKTRGAHHADVGGMTSGSMPLSTSIFQEGVIIPPLKLVEKGNIDKKIMDFLLNNVRTPMEREGDFASQIMANITGVRRTGELIEKYGLETVRFYAGCLRPITVLTKKGSIVDARFPAAVAGGCGEKCSHQKKSSARKGK